MLLVNFLSQNFLKQSLGGTADLVAKNNIDLIDRIIYRRLERWESYIGSNNSLYEFLRKSNKEFGKINNLEELFKEKDSEWVKDNTEKNPAISKVLNNELSYELQGKTKFYNEKYSFDVFPEVFVTNKYGAILASTGITSDYYQADEEWWQQAKENEFYISDVSYDDSSKTNSVEICIKIEDENKDFLGVLKAVFNIKDIEDAIEIAKQNSINELGNESIQLSLFKSKGELIYSTAKEEDVEIDLNKEEHEIYTQVAQKTGIEKLYSQHESTGYLDFKGKGWVLLVTQNTSEIFSPLSSLNTIILITIFISAIIVFIISNVFAKAISKPIEELNKGVEIISKGDLNYKVGMDTKDEMGELSRQFDVMTQSIKEARADVNKKVEQQTEKINEQKEKLEKQQDSLINVLDEVQSAKTKAEELAGDLKKFQLAVDNASDQIVITDKEGIGIYANNALEKITGFKKEEVIGKKVGTKELWGGLMDKEYYEKMWKTIKTGKKILVDEVKNKRKSGEYYEAQVNISPILDPKTGEVLFFVGIERDITKAKEVDRMKTEFISLASHQLKTPLSAMKWFGEMLLNGDAGKLNKEQEEYTKNIYESNERMISLVNALLNISRIESGRIIIEPEETSLNELIEKEVLTSLKKKADEKKINLVISINKNLNKVMVDKKMIAEVYSNLISNAIKYTKEGGEINIFVSTKGDEIVNQISDNGYGIPKEEQDKVFSKFFRATNTSKLETDGSGLGLYLIKAIVESSGGKIWFESEENKGTTFWFTLPKEGMRAKKGDVHLNN